MLAEDHVIFCFKTAPTAQVATRYVAEAPTAIPVDQLPTIVVGQTSSPFNNDMFPNLVVTGHEGEWIYAHLSDVWDQVLYDFIRKDLYWSTDTGANWDKRYAMAVGMEQQGFTDGTIVDLMQDGAMGSRENVINAVAELKADLVAAGVQHDLWDATAQYWIAHDMI